MQSGSLSCGPGGEGNPFSFQFGSTFLSLWGPCTSDLTFPPPCSFFFFQNGLNALHLAAKEGHVDLVQELLERGASVDSATKVT